MVPTQIRKRAVISGGRNEQIGILSISGEVTPTSIGAAVSRPPRLRGRLIGLRAGACCRRKNPLAAAAANNVRRVTSFIPLTPSSIGFLQISPRTAITSCCSDALGISGSADVNKQSNQGSVSPS